MSDLNIYDLPPEMLTKVFRFLDVVNLKTATLTCKLWKNLIESTCRWSLILNFHKNGEFTSRYLSAEQKMNFIMRTDRKFGKIEIYFKVIDEDNQLYQIFNRHGFNVVELGIFCCRFNNLLSLAELLNFTPNLMDANLFEVHLLSASDMPLDHVLPNLKKLKNVKIESDGQIIKCFRKAKVTTMEIGLPSLHLGDGRGYFSDSFVDFLLCQDMLTSLSVDSWASSILVEMGKRKELIPFRLTKLTSNVARRYLTSAHDHDNLLRFVKTQVENLTELSLGINLASSLYECVFSSMTKLNTLVVSIDGIPRENDSYDHLKENCNIRTIKLLDYGFSKDYVAGFLKKLPNIRHLIMPHIESVNVLATVAQILKKLESLYTGHFDENLIGSVSFPNLKTLHIRNLRGQIDWNDFTKIHSRLAELTVEKIDNKSYLTSDDIDQIATNIDLQHIRLGVGFVVDDRFFEIVRSKCTNLKTLDLDKSCIPHGLNYNVEINVLRLYDFGSCKTFRDIWSKNDGSTRLI